MAPMVALLGFGWIAFGVFALDYMPTDIQLGVAVSSFAAGTMLVMLSAFVHDLNRKLARILPKLPHEE